MTIIASSAFCAETGTDAVTIFTLKDTIKMAHMTNKPLQIQEEDIAYARGNILYAQSNFLPKVDMQYSYTLNDATPPVIPLGPSRKDPQIFTGYKNNNVFGLSLNESVYNGGANIATLEQARLDLKVARETVRSTKLEVEFDAKRLYYGLLLAYENARIAGDTVERAKVHRDDVKNMLEQGTASKFDFLQSEVQVSKLIPNLVRAQNEVEVVTAELKKLLSMPQSQNIRIEGRLDYSPIQIKEEDFLAQAYRNKPEMILKILGVDLKKWGIEYAKAGWLPQVSANAAYTNTSNNIGDMINSRHNNWNIGVTASIAVFDGFSTKAKVDEAKARYAQAGLEKENYADQLAVDIKSACLDMVKSAAIIKSQEDSLVEAKEAMRIAEVGYENGVITNLDVLTSQVDLAQVETNLASGLYDYIMAKAQIDKLTGREYIEGGG
jgi:outer membrane protein